MKSVKLFAASAIIGAASFALGTVSVSKDAKAEGEKEKCYGVVKAGKNDCGTKSHSCAGQAAEDGGADEWVFVPKGLCERLVGGSASSDQSEG